MYPVQGSVVLPVVVVVIVAFIESGDALYCWKCTTASDVNCKDYFNVTRVNQDRLQNEINQNLWRIMKQAHLEKCEDNYLPDDQKYVCLKTITNYRLPNGLPIVTRKCRIVPLTLGEGKCPEDLERKSDFGFCGSCHSDGCNSANGLQTNIMLACLLPVIFLVLMKQ